MSLLLNIPKIAITPEDEDDDDNDNLLNLAEALTDVEELYVDQVSTRRNSFKKKLKIKVTDNDGYNTALEDVEASDEDDVTPAIQQHDCPISMEDLDLEQFTTEENYGITMKTSNDFEYFNLQTAKTNEILLSNSSDLSDVPSLTDVEYYDTENEFDEYKDIPDAEFYSDNGEALQLITITDEIQEKKQSPHEQNNLDATTPIKPSVFPNTLLEEKNVKPPIKRPPTFSQMMKAKRNAGNTRTRRRKRNKINVEPKKTDENDSSENESIKPGNANCVLSSNSLNYESDVEEENKLQFPVCKKTFSKNKQQLIMPDYDVNVKTDVEDFECEVETCKRRISVDGTLFHKQLDEMASCYSFTKDKNETKLMPNEDEELVPSYTDSDKINKDVSRSTIPTTGMEEDGVTDVEYISNSHDQEVKTEYETEEELFKGFPNELTFIPEVVLPPPTRILVISEENKTLIPTVRILPLDGNHHSDSECEEKSTDDESMDSATEFTLRGVRNLHSPQLPLYESENVKMSENTINPSFNKLTIEDALTDVEDLDAEPSKLEVEKKSIFLSPNKSPAGYFTDLEDLEIADGKFLSEGEGGGHTEFEYFDSSDDESFLGKKRNFSLKLKYPSLNPLGHTDTEDLVASTDEENHYSRAETATPHELRKESEEISGINMDKENDSNMDRTSTEEVMYLKGGGFQDLFVDTDQFFGDVMDAWEYFNQVNCSSQKEWNAIEDTQTSSKSQGDTVEEDKTVTSELHTKIIPSVSYESILLSSKPKDCVIGCPPDYDSYSQIDAMLDRMFIAVDEINLSQDFHTNSLTLEPSSDALIEIPIKKSKSNKTFTATANIFVDEEVENSNSMKIDDNSRSDDVDFSSSEYLDSFYKDEIFFGDTLNAHEKTENLYEPVESKASLYSGDSDYIWWEGTYRNLSVVVEEDEENYNMKDGKEENIKNPQMKDTQIHTFYPTTSAYITEYGSESSQVFSSMSTEDSDSDHSDTMIKAEVKLKITSKEDGLDAIEVKSVKEFMLENDKEFKESTDKVPKKKLKFKKKLMTMLDKRKTDSGTLSIDKSEPSYRKKTARPSFTLPRIFIKNSNPEVSSSEIVKRKNDIIAKPNENFPLSLNHTNVVENDSPKKIDLFANMPFYPVYTDRHGSCAVQTSNSITYVPPSDVTISEAYCNWSDTENNRGKTTSTRFLNKLEDELLDYSPPSVAFPKPESNKFTTPTRISNASTRIGKDDNEKFVCTSTIDVREKGEISRIEVQKTISIERISNEKKEKSLIELPISSNALPESTTKKDKQALVDVTSDDISITSSFIENEKQKYVVICQKKSSSADKEKTVESNEMILEKRPYVFSNEVTIIEKQDNETSKEYIDVSNEISQSNTKKSTLQEIDEAKLSFLKTEIDKHEVDDPHLELTRAENLEISEKSQIQSEPNERSEKKAGTLEPSELKEKTKYFLSDEIEKYDNIFNNQMQSTSLSSKPVKEHNQIILEQKILPKLSATSENENSIGRSDRNNQYPIDVIDPDDHVIDTIVRKPKESSKSEKIEKSEMLTFFKSKSQEEKKDGKAIENVRNNIVSEKIKERTTEFLRREKVNYDGNHIKLEASTRLTGNVLHERIESTKDIDEQETNRIDITEKYNTIKQKTDKGNQEEKFVTELSKDNIKPSEIRENSSHLNNLQNMKVLTSVFIDGERDSYVESEEGKYFKQKSEKTVSMENNQYQVQWPYTKIKEITNQFVSTEVMNFHDVKYTPPNGMSHQCETIGEERAETNIDTPQNESKMTEKHEFMSFLTKKSNKDLQKNIEVKNLEIKENNALSDDNNSSYSPREMKKEYGILKVDHAPVESTQLNQGNKQSLDSENQKLTENIEEHREVLWSFDRILNMTDVFLNNELRNYHDDKSLEEKISNATNLIEQYPEGKRKETNLPITLPLQEKTEIKYSTTQTTTERTVEKITTDNLYQEQNMKNLQKNPIPSKEESSEISSFPKEDKKIQSEDSKNLTKNQERSSLKVKEETSLFLQQERNNYEDHKIISTKKGMKNVKTTLTTSLKDGVQMDSYNDQNENMINPASTRTRDITEEFINNEVQNFHDVKYFVPGIESDVQKSHSTSEKTEQKPKFKKESRKRSGLLSFFKRKSSDERQDSESSKFVEKNKKPKHEFLEANQQKMFETRDTDDDDDTKERTETEGDFAELRKITKDFLFDEIKMYQDVKYSPEKEPRITNQQITQLADDKNERIKTQELIYPQEKGMNTIHQRTGGNDTVKTNISDETSEKVEKSSFINLFEEKSRKDKKEKSDGEVDKIEDKINVVSENLANASSSFLTNEKETYEDSNNIIERNRNLSQDKVMISGKQETTLTEIQPLEDKNTIISSNNFKQLTNEFLNDEKTYHEDMRNSESSKFESDASNTKIRHSSESSQNDDICANENTKTIKKEEKSGILTFLKGKFKKSPRTDSEDNSEQTKMIMNSPTLKRLTSSFLLEEKQIYEDGQTNFKLSTPVFNGHKLNAKPSESTAEQKYSETINICENDEQHQLELPQTNQQNTKNDDKKQHESERNASNEFQKITNDFLSKELEMYQDVKYVESEKETKITNQEISQLSAEKNKSVKDEELVYPQDKRQVMNTIQQRTSVSDTVKSNVSAETSEEVEKSSFLDFFRVKSKKDKKNKSDSGNQMENKINVDSGNLANASSSFSQKEKEIYEDSKYIIETNGSLSQEKAQKVHVVISGKQETSLSEINLSEDKNRIISSNNFRELTNEFLNDEKKYYEDMKYSDSSKLEKKYTSEQTQNKTLLESVDSHEKPKELKNAKKNGDVSNTKTQDSSEINRDGDELSNESSRKTIKKREKAGILTFLKGKLKKGPKTDSEDNSECELSFSEVKHETSSFLLEEKRKYEDSSINLKNSSIVFTENKIHDAKPSENVPQERTTDYEVSNCQEEEMSKENNRSLHDQFRIDKKIDQHTNVSDEGDMEFEDMQTKIASITQSFLDREKIYENNSKMSNISTQRTGDKKMNEIKNEHIIETSREHHPEDPQDWFSSKDMEITNNFLITEKQLYDFTTSDSHKISVEIDKQKSYNIQRNENLTDSISTSDAKQKSDAPAKTNKKRRILGFLKKKSKESEDFPTEIRMKDVTEEKKKKEIGKTPSHDKNSTDNEKQQESTEFRTEEEDPNEIAKKTIKPQKKPHEDQDIADSKKGILGFLFKKKKPKNKEETSTYHKADDFLEILENTKTFLHRETEMYHDTNREYSGNTSNMPHLTIEKPQNDVNPSKIIEQKIIAEKVHDNTLPHTHVSFSDNVGTINESTEEEKINTVNPEYMAFDFIKEEIETFESTKAPNTSKIDSSIRIETEVETIDGESPKEIITKKIIISEKLIQKNNGMSDSSTSEEILRKLIDVNDELKAQLNLEEISESENKFQQVPEPQSTTSEKLEETAVDEIADKIAAIELARSNIVEDVSVFEGTADRLKKEVVTDLDDITSDESYSSDSRRKKEIVEMLKEKYPEYYNEHIPIIEDDIVWKTVGVDESITEEKSIYLPKNIGKDESNRPKSNKKVTITKLNEPGTTMSSMSDASQVTEDLVTDLKMEYLPYTKDLKEDVTSGKMRKPIFRIESEEENCTAINEEDPDTQLNNLLRELQTNNEDCHKDTTLKKENHTEENKDEIVQSDIDILEKKLSELGKALDTLEQLNEVEPPKTNELRERKLRRVERKFERMASETIELSNKTSVDLANSAESQQYQQLVSQLSQDEVMSFQGDFNNLLEEYTFSKSDEWDSKTPDSQADVLELPQGEIVYMAPVKLNVNHSVNKAGVEVDVIPIMPSPNVSPKAKKKRRRHRSTTCSNESQSPSPAKQHPHSYLQDSITKRILEINPRRFLSGTFTNEENDSHFDENLWSTKSLDNISIPTGERPIMNAVVDWLATPKKKRFPFEFDSGKDSSMKNTKDNCQLGDISSMDVQSVSLNVQYIDTSCKELTEASQNFPTNTQPPQPKPRQQKSKEQIEEEPTETDTATKQLSPVRDDLLDDTVKTDDISYQDKKKFWENIAKEPSRKQVEVAPFTKRNSVQEIGTPPIPKPRGTLQSSYSIAETTTEKISMDDSILSMKDRSETKKIDRIEETKITEIETPEVISIDTQSKENIQEVPSKEVKKSESVETEDSSSQGGDNAGYISDSGDVEQYISDSEIEDRVPQIRERQMSVFVPPSVSQRTRYERSASLPTEDLYEVSARSTKLRKQYYEEQIKKEMIKEQLTIELEDEGSPERKSIASPEGKPEDTSSVIPIEVPTNDREDVIFESEQEHEEDSAAEQQNVFAGKDETVEIHVDKSETEKSEKLIEIIPNAYDQDIMSPSHMQDNIPEITYTLSGIQKRISEESEDDDNEKIPEITYTLSGIQRRISEESEDEDNEKIPEITYSLSGIQKRMSEESEDDEIIKPVLDHVKKVESDDTQEKLRREEITEEISDNSPAHEASTEKICSEAESIKTPQSTEELKEIDFQTEAIPQIEKELESTVEQQISELQTQQKETEHLEEIETQLKKVHVDEPEASVTSHQGVVKSSSGQVECQQQQKETEHFEEIETQLKKVHVDEPEASVTSHQGGIKSSSGQVECQEKKIEESEHKETMASAAEKEKLSTETILDDSIADIDLESEDLKQIVSRLESMHKFRKLKGKSSGIPKPIGKIQKVTTSVDIQTKVESSKEESKQEETKKTILQSKEEIKIADEASLSTEEQPKGQISMKNVDQQTTKIASEVESSKTIDDQCTRLKSPADISKPLCDKVTTEVESIIKETKSVTETVSVSSKLHDETSTHIHTVIDSKLSNEIIKEDDNYKTNKIETASETTEIIKTVQDINTEITSGKQKLTEGIEELKLETEKTLETETNKFYETKINEDIKHTRKTVEIVESEFSSDNIQKSETTKQDIISSEIEPSHEGLKSPSKDIREMQLTEEHSPKEDDTQKQFDNERSSERSQITEIMESDIISKTLPLNEKLESPQKEKFASQMKEAEPSTEIKSEEGTEVKLTEFSIDQEKTSTSTQPKADKVNSYTIINQPQENIENTVWEVSVESETLREEKLTSLPTSFKGDSAETKSDSISEKVNDSKFLDENTTDETNLESEKLDQERSDSLNSNKLEYDGHDDMKRIILESLHQQKVDPEEARMIANSLIEEIESEIQKVERFNRGLSSKSDSLESEKHVTDYLKELAESKGLDQREVELVESVLERRQRQISKLSRGDTQASSMEITDEDLRYSETDYDYSNVLQQQMGQLEAEYSDHLKNVYDSLVEDQSSINTSAQNVSLPNQDDQDANNKNKDEQMRIEKTHMHQRDIILEEDENFNESSTDELTDLKTKPDTTDPTKVGGENIDPLQAQGEVIISVDNNQQSNIHELIQQGEMKTDKIQDLNRDIQSQEMHTVEKFSTSEKEDSKESIKRTSSSDSKSSIGSSKTPEDLYSTCSSKKIDSETSSEVVFRKSKRHDDAKKVDRKSGLDLEAYSSSGESHYHSFEIDNKSRPCSSDIEGILPTGSSEYESALNSQDLSMKSQMTSAEYHTAISSLSSKESMMSIESECSGNLASIEVSETSETLVPTNSDLEGDMDDQQMFDDSELWPSSSEFESNDNITEDQINQSVSSQPSSTENVDIPSKMKRSHEMTFQPEPKVPATDSLHTDPNDIEEKFGTSLDDASALSVSLSSTSSAQLRTVIELSRTESGGPEESLTSAFSEHVSLDDDLPIKYPENIAFVDSSTSTNTICKEPIESVTILSATITDNGVSSVCSQVTTEPAPSSEGQKPNHEELKKKGHRRQESTSFIPSLIHSVIKPSEPQTLFEIEQKTEHAVDAEAPTERTERSSIEKAIDLSIKRETSERRDSHGKSSSTSSEKSSFEEAEAEAAFNMVAHISPVHKIKQICPIIEDIDAEKIESEAKERAERARIERAQQLKDASPGSIPDIKVTEHMAPLDESNFRYPELEIEREELERENRKAQDDESPLAIEAEKPIDTEDITIDSLEDDECEIKEEPSKAPITEEKTTKEVSSVSKNGNDDDRASDSPNSDSFELVDRPDIIDDFVVIEEIGKEASEMDSEGKSMAIQSKSKSHRKRDEEIDAYLARSDPTPLTKMTELKYFPDANYDLEFEFEDSPPQAHGDTNTKDYGSKYDKELEANRKWIEQQFHGDHAAMTAAGYGYEMEFERGPLEDIKEEDINDIDLASSRIGSLGSQKDSGGSGSVKDSYSSTPEYDVLAGRRYFTRSGEHDDISMSSLQEFENLERAMSLETKRIYHGSGSQESSSNGSFKTRYYSNKGQGDDISVSSLKEFEGLERACIAVYKTEIKVKEEEALLSHIDELKEILPTETKTELKEILPTETETIKEEPIEENKVIDSTDKSRVTESDEEDYEKRMFEIDEIIRQAQNNVEKFAEMKEPEKTESLGRGDSIEEVSKVPDLDLDAPISKCKDDDPMVTSTDSLDLEQNKTNQYGSTDSLDPKNPALDIMTASTDSIEFNNQLSKNITTYSMDNKTEASNMVCSDSLDIAAAVSSRPQIDSLEEDEPKIFADHSSSDTGKDFSSSARDDVDEQLHELMLGSTDSLEPTSSTATHATYQYETDSVFSGSFTSGGSNTMVSSTDTIDPNIPSENVDIAAAVRKVWFDEGTSASGRNITTEFFEESSMPYVTEVIEPSDDPAFSHTIHRRVQMPMEVRKVTFHGEEADKQLDQFIKDFGENEEEVHETEEIDADGNVHTRRVVQKRFIVRSGDEAVNLGDTFRTEGDKLTLNACSSQLTTITKTITGETSQPHEHSDTISSKAQAFRRRPLRYDISVDDQTEVDPREHDWLFYLNKDDQPESSTEEGYGQMRQQPLDQHQLSTEMKELLKEMEEASKK